jgi:hypothetical protein
VSHWIITGLVALLGFVGLVLAAGALDDGMHLFGMGLVIFSVTFVWFSVKRHFDRLERGTAA